MAKQLHPLADLPPILWEMVSWLEEICPYQYTEKYIKYFQSEDNKMHTFKIYTKENQYNVSVHIDDSGKPRYLGCSFLTRKPRAGEDWNRGNDLPDGVYSRRRWSLIRSAIIATELVKVISPKHPEEDSIINYNRNRKHFVDKDTIELLPTWHSSRLKKEHEGRDTKELDNLLKTFKGKIIK